MTAAPRLRRRLLLVSLPALVAALVWWATGRDDASAPGPAIPSQRAQPASSADAGPGNGPGVPARAPLEAARTTTEVADAGRSTRIVPEPAAHLEPVILELVTPERRPLEVPDARGTLRDEAGRAFELRTVEGAPARLHGAVPAGRYVLTVEAPGFRHLPETLALDDLGRREDVDGVLAFHERVTLWPAQWLPVVVRTSDGRPFVALAADLGWEPKRAFVDAFRVTTGHAPDDVARGDEGLATFRPPGGYQNVLVGGAIAGSLEERAPRPYWAGLWVHGVFHAAQLVDAASEEVAFVLDADDLDARLAQVTLRVVDRDSRAPVPEARVTLKAETSAHRRTDLQEVAPDLGGRVDLRRAIPGPHELTVTRGDNLVQRRVTLAPGERLDLGDVSIGDEPGVPLRVVLEGGSPVRAAIEVAPYSEGAAVEDLFHPNLHRWTDGEGRYVLPVPEQPSIVRARPFFDESGTLPSQVGTANVLVDPAALPADLVLVARPPVRVRFTHATPWVEGDRLEVEDELRLVVGVLGRASGTLELVPGNYRLWRIGAAGARTGPLDVAVGAGTDVVAAP